MTDLRNSGRVAPRVGDPQEIGPYKIIGFLGEGGQGAVYLGETPEGRPVAIKVLHTRLAADERGRARFLRELDAARRVARFCTAQVLDVEAEGSQPYLVSEYVDGPSLRQLVKRGGPLDAASLERLAIGTATALSAIHNAGIVHRDLNPGNVLLGPDGPRVVDFGIAKALESALESTERLGTPAYMAPEQFTSTELGTAADVFSWAGTMMFAATGEPPFGKASLGLVMNKILTEVPDTSVLPPSLQPVVARAFARRPADRPDAEQVLQFLLGQVDALDTTVPPGGAEALGTAAAAGPVTTARRPSRRKLLLGGVGAATLAGGAGAYLLLGRDEPAADRLTVTRTRTLTGHREIVSSLEFGRLKGGPILASAGGRDTTVRIWNLATGRPLGYKISHKDPSGSDYVRSLSLLGDVLASCGAGPEDRSVKLWDLRSGRHTGTITAPGRTPESMFDVVLAHIDGKDVVVANTGTRIVVHDLRTRRRLREYTTYSDWITSMTVALTPAGPLIVTGGNDGQIHVWAADKSRRWTMGEHSGNVNALAYRAIGGRPVLVSGGDDTTVRFWDLTLSKQTQRLPDHTLPVRAVVIAATFVASAGDDDRLRFWHPVTGKQLTAPREVGTEGVNSLGWDGSGTLATGGHDSRIGVWKIRKRS